MVKQLKERKVKDLDIVVITHPHGDHMGGMAELFKDFKIKQIYDNGQSANTAMYRNYLKNIKAKNIAYKVLKKGDTFTLGDDVKFTVLSPAKPFTKENTQGVSESGLTNNNSIVCKMTYGQFSMMFTGDAQKEAEDQILKAYKPADLKSDVLKSAITAARPRRPTPSSKPSRRKRQPSPVLPVISTNSRMNRP